MSKKITALWYDESGALVNIGDFKKLLERMEVTYFNSIPIIVDPHCPPDHLFFIKENNVVLTVKNVSLKR